MIFSIRINSIYRLSIGPPPTNNQPMLRTLRLRGVRAYHAIDHPNPIIANNPQTVILDEALKLVPTYGFTRECITAATRHLNYSDATGSIVKDFDLPIHWLKTQRANLEKYAIAPESPLHQITDEYARATNLMQTRLSYNNQIDLKELVALLALPYNMPESAAELHNLSDDIAFYAGDASNDFAWYTKRMGLSSIYVLLELYQIQNPGNVDAFVADKIALLKEMGAAYNNVEEWALFNGISAFNLIKSQLMRG